MFENIIGHENIKENLLRALESGRLGQAYLLSGQDGVGKFLFAKSFAQKLIGVTEDHPDIMILSPDEKGSIKIDAIREAAHYLRISPLSSDRKILIINDAHFMTESAENSLLRVLEEPPDLRHIFIITDRPYKLLPTIRSRCQKLKFSPLKDDELALVLRKINVEEDSINAVIPYSEGSVSRALSLTAETVENAKKIMSMNGKNIGLLLDAAEELSAKEKTERSGRSVLTTLASLYRKKWRDDISIGNDCSEFLAKWIILSSALEVIDTAVNKQLLFEEMMIRLAETLNVIPAKAGIQR